MPKRMYYVDNSQGLYIDLYPGVQVLKGEELEGFLRFRHDELGDIGRLERQKLVLSAVFRKLAQPATVTRLPELLRIAGDDIRTDLSPVELATLLGAMSSTKLRTSQLPGRLYWYNDLSYWLPESGHARATRRPKRGLRQPRASEAPRLDPPRTPAAVQGLAGGWEAGTVGRAGSGAGGTLGSGASPSRRGTTGGAGVESVSPDQDWAWPPDPPPRWRSAAPAAGSGSAAGC